MGVFAWIGRRADRPLVAALAFGGAALAYTVAYVGFVSPYGLFVVPAEALVASATVGGAISGYLIWRFRIALGSGRTVRGHALSGLLVGWLTLVVAPPLAILGMTLPSLFGYADVSLLTPLLIAGYLVNAVAWGFVGTLVATVATLGTPLLVTTLVGAALGYLRGRPDAASPAPPGDPEG